MRKLLPAALIVVLTTLVLASAPARAQQQVRETYPQAQEVGTWTGEVLDLACYLTTGAMGEANKQCRIAKGKKFDPLGVKNGQPMGLLTDDGTLVLLVPAIDVAPFKALASRVGEQVRVKGRLVERDDHVGLLILDASGSM